MRSIRARLKKVLRNSLRTPSKKVLRTFRGERGGALVSSQETAKVRTAESSDNGARCTNRSWAIALESMKDPRAFLAFAEHHPGESIDTPKSAQLHIQSSSVLFCPTRKRTVLKTAWPEIWRVLRAQFGAASAAIWPNSGATPRKRAQFQ